MGGCCSCPNSQQFGKEAMKEISKSITSLGENIKTGFENGTKNLQMGIQNLQMGIQYFSDALIQIFSILGFVFFIYGIRDFSSLIFQFICIIILGFLYQIWWMKNIM